PRVGGTTGRRPPGRNAGACLEPSFGAWDRGISGNRPVRFRPRAALACAASGSPNEGAAMWVVKLTDKQLEVLRAVLRAEEHLGPALRGALEALDLARWDDLPEAQLPWDDVSETARRQGISEADVIWDLAGKKKRMAAEGRFPHAEPSLVLVEARAALAPDPSLA